MNWTRYDKRIFQHLQDGCIIVKSNGPFEGYAVYTARSGKKLGGNHYTQKLSPKKFQQYLDAKMVKRVKNYWAAAWDDMPPQLAIV